MKNSKKLAIHSIRKKILIASKVTGAILIISYIIATKLPFSQDTSLFIWTLFLALLVLTIDFLMSRFITRPVDSLVGTAEKMAGLDFSSPCRVTGDDEFGKLAVSLNSMAENLQKALKELETANRQLAKDVEKERLLLEERKELADNISHEMKTPLGIIRAYAEGLQDENDREKRRKYSEIMIAETERMSDLITTLLDLSALETGAKELTPERFDFVEFLETVAGRLLSDEPEADLELRYELPEHIIFVYTDKLWMEQVLNNLILNAKKNVCQGGILKLCLWEEKGSLHFSVYNQGCTIPQENLDKIWTKFYRNDNSQYKGSGLGLAIVAQILSMQGLNFGVQNLSDGVQFYFSVPIVS